MPRPTATVPRINPRRHRRSWLGTAFARDIRAKVQAPVTPRPVAYGGHPVVAIVAPPLPLLPLEDPVSMLDQPELTPEWEAYLKTSTPPDIGIKRKRESSPTFGKNYPTKKDSPFSTPHRTPHIPSAPMSYAPTRLPSPEPLPAYRPRRPRR